MEVLGVNGLCHQCAFTSGFKLCADKNEFPFPKASRCCVEGSNEKGCFGIPCLAFDGSLKTNALCNSTSTLCGNYGLNASN
jgi:hypothetical protein